MNKELWQEDAERNGYLSDYQKEYRETHKDQLKKYMQTYRKEHPDKIRQQDREAAARYRSRKKMHDDPKGEGV